MIHSSAADNIAEAARGVTAALLSHSDPWEPVIIKPNIVAPSAPPVTTDVRVVKGIITALQDKGIRNIIVAEGSGTGNTADNFAMLGYTELGVPLVDLDEEETVRVQLENFREWNTLFLPRIVINACVISVPVLKEHSICGISGSIKNMVGILPATHYAGYWTYKKSQIHKGNVHDCIADIISVVKPFWAVVDATVGMRGSHLSGTPLSPPLNTVYGSSDILEADIHGCELLNRRWEDVPYLTLVRDAPGHHGSAPHP